MTKRLLLAAGVLLATSAIAQETAPEALYLVGSFNDWTVPANGGTDYALNDEDGDGVYTGSFNLSAGELQFKIFKSADADWMQPDLYMGATERYYKIYGDIENQIVVAPEPVSGYSYNITIRNWEGGDIELSASAGEDGYWNVIINAPGQPDKPEVEIVDELFLIGAAQGWNIGYGYYQFENVGFQEFEGKFIIPATADVPGGVLNNFRFYSKLDDFMTNSIGAPGNDVPLNLEEGTPVTMTGEANSLFNWDLTNWDTAGYLKIHADINTMTFIFEREEIPPYEPSLYLIGSPQGWNINDGSMKCENVADGVFEITFMNNEESPVFRFYTELGDWETNSVGSQVVDNPVNVFMDEETFTTSCVWGKGSWRLEGVKDCSLTARVDLNAMEVKFTNNNKTSVEELGVGASNVSYYDLLGNRVSNPSKGIFIRVENEKVSKVVL